MAELVVIGFKKDMYRASEVLNKLTSLEDRWAVELHDGIAVYRDYGGELRLDQSLNMTAGEGAGWGLFWGSMFGALLAAPFTAGASAAAAASAVAAGTLGGGLLGATTGALDAKWWRQDFGISEDFVREVSAMIQPGDSAVFVIIRSADPEAVVKQFAGYGGTVLRTTLTAEQNAKLQNVLNSVKKRAA
jgi:uncharacterized membrane protein